MKIFLNRSVFIVSDWNVFGWRNLFSATVQQIETNLQIVIVNRAESENLHFSKIKNNGRPPYWKKTAISPTPFNQSRRNFAGICRLILLTVQKVKICVGVYVQILPKRFKVCANGLIVVKITVAVGGKSGNKTAKINVKYLFDLLLGVRAMTDDLH